MLKLSDTDLEYTILEDLDIEYYSMFHKSTLDYLLANGMISYGICEQVLILKEKIEEMLSIGEKRNFMAFRNDPKWHEIYLLSDKVLYELGK